MIYWLMWACILYILYIAWDKSCSCKGVFVLIVWNFRGVARLRFWVQPIDNEMGFVTFVPKSKFKLILFVDTKIV